jgi:hypothetical protein
MYLIGDKVKATKKIREGDFNGHKVWVHAYPGDTGTVIHINENHLPTVRFDKSLTATLTFSSEIEKVDGPG